MRYLCYLFSTTWFFLLLSNSMQAQNRRDFGIWSGLKINQKLTDNLSASLRGQVRLKGNAAYFRNTFANLSLNYKFHKIFALTAGYRYSIRNNGNNHRAYADAKFIYKIKAARTTFKLRLRAQYNTSNDYSDVPSTLLRPRFYMAYAPKGSFLKRFDFYITAEIFYEFIQSSQALNKYRLSAGLIYELSKNIDLNLRYIYQDEIGIAAPVQDNVLYIVLAIDLPGFKNKKKSK